MTQLVSHPLKGAGLVALAVMVFACMDSMTKHLAAEYNVPLIVALRYGGNLVWLVLVFAPREGWAMLRVQRRGLVALRALSLSCASLFAGLALQRMPVAETVAIIFLSPFGIMLLSERVLGERVGLLGWLAAALGFAGVLLIVRPGSGLDGWGVLFAALTAAVTLIYNMLSRVLARTETTVALMFYTTLMGALFFGAVLPWSWHGPAPSALNVVVFAAMGAMALLGHFLFTAAYRFAPASALAPVNYLQLFWAGLLGWLIFDHVPDATSLVGMAMVAVAGAGSALLAHLMRMRAAQP